MIMFKVQVRTNLRGLYTSISNFPLFKNEERIRFFKYMD